MPLETITEKAVKQTIEKLETHECQQAILYHGECGETATYRVRKGTLTVYFCDAHAERFLRGSDLLSSVKCSKCGEPCKPGYLYNSNSGWSFCRVACQTVYERANERAYR